MSKHQDTHHHIFFTVTNHEVLRPHHPSRCRQHGQRPLHLPRTRRQGPKDRSVAIRPQDCQLPVQWYASQSIPITPLPNTHLTPHLGPTTDVTADAIRCYELAPGTGSKTYTVNAGDSVGFTAASSISHPGPLQFYLAKVPEGKTAATWDGSGDVWFKIFSQGATFSGGQMNWPSNGMFSSYIPRQRTSH